MLDIIMSIAILVLIGYIFFILIMGMGKALSDFLYYTIHRHDDDTKS